MHKTIGLIAGTGFYDLPAIKHGVNRKVTNEYGEVNFTIGEWDSFPIVFIARHGVGHTIPPHRINYRANIRALKDSGVAAVIAINVVGAIDSVIKPGDLSLINDFIDFTSGREHTFFDGLSEDGVQHVDVSTPYDPRLQEKLKQSAESQNIPLHLNGVYAGFNGPRFETPAEIRFAALGGATVVGMTGCPEVSLAKELKLPYASIALSVNPAAGLSEGEITMEDINAALHLGKGRTLQVIAGALPLLSKL